MDAPVPEFDHATSDRRRATLLEWKGWPLKIPRHRHRHDAELGFVVAGTGRYASGDRAFTLGPGRLFFVPPGVPHGSSGVERRFHCWMLSVPFARLDAVTVVKSAANVVARIPPAEARRLGRMLCDLAAEPDDAVFDAGAEYVAASALASLGRASSEDVSIPIHPAVERATRLIEAESGNVPGLSLDALARRSGVSRSSLTAAFRKHHGMSIVAFRNRERLHRFLELYASRPDLGVTGAAFEVGFGSYSQFYRTFYEVVGCTPADYARDAGCARTRSSGT